MAAPTYALVQLSPSRGKLTITKTATGNDDVTIPNADLRAAFAAGTPLGDLVREYVADQDASVAVLMGGAVPPQHGCGRIFFAGQLDGVIAFPPSVVPDETANDIIVVINTVSAAGTWLFYIEAVPSLAR